MRTFAPRQRPSQKQTSSTASAEIAARSRSGLHTPSVSQQTAGNQALRRALGKGVGNQAIRGAPPIVHEVLRSPGQPLDADTRAFMEPRFGHGFSHVRVHTDEKAAESARTVNALAYTVGRDVVFGTGQYSPATTHGRALMAHELTHVVQQGQSKLDTGTSVIIGRHDDAAEAEADRTASHVMRQANAGDVRADGTHQPVLRRISFGSDGRLSPDRQATVSQAATIAITLVQGADFAQRFEAFWKGPGRRITPKFSLTEYRAAVLGRVVHDMDTSQRPDVKKFVADESKMALERQTAAVTPIGSKDSYMRQFAVDQGIDSVVSLILHESLHGAGATMGGSLQIYEPIFHGFEASVGFPIMMGGADIRMRDTAPSDPQIDINIFYVLREIGGDPLPTNIELQVVDQATGRNVAFRQNLPSKAGLGQVTWRAYSPAPGVYSVRIVDVGTDSLMTSHQLIIGPPSPPPLAPPVPSPSAPPPATSPGFWEKIKKFFWG